jgi:hypothetical protein
MFTFKKETEPDLLSLAIEDAHRRLAENAPSTDNYAKIADQIIKLTKLKAEITAKSKVSADTIVLVAANIAGILLIIGHERVNVIATKAIGFVLKTK